ncbi:MAG: pseudouridine synthase [Ilumatobacteraceae bacterium]
MPQPEQYEPPLWEQWQADNAPKPNEPGEPSGDQTRPSETGERLQKVLAVRGWGSRRVCEELIAAGRATVNGEVAVLGRRVDVEHDAVQVDGLPIGVRPGLVYYLLNKPAGVVTTAHDPQGRPTVVEMVPDHPRVYPVGRLDVPTEGLLMLTNDGDLANRLAHPSHGVEKEYLAEVEGVVGGGALRRLREGVQLDDGITAPAKVSQPAPGVLRLTIHEGRNRQIRRMCETVGHPVRRLVRVRIGTLRDADLLPGTWREIAAEEIQRLVTSTVPRTRRERRDRSAPRAEPSDG